MRTSCPNEPFKGKVLFKTKYNKYFKENLKVSDILSADADDLIARLAQHIPLPRIRLIRYFDLADFQSGFIKEQRFRTS
jgi:hypothetical protein